MPESSANPITAATRYCAVFGHPIHHSASPAMQNAGLAALNLDWRYLAFDVHPDHLQAAIDGAKRMRFVGLNLTIPHKLLALDMVDHLDESARTWGAVNTIRFEVEDNHGTWNPLPSRPDDSQRPIRSHGFNTDADAITRSIQEDLKLTLAGSRILLLGTGGAGKTAALKLAADKVANLFLVNRSVDKAVAVKDEIQRRFPSVTVTVGYPSSAQTVDLIINATSLGLKPDDPLPLDTLEFAPSRAGAVFDMIYRPAATPLLRHAQTAGCPTANGLGMLLYQGAKALELWTGRNPPIDIMRSALEKNVYGN